MSLLFVAGVLGVFAIIAFTVVLMRERGMQIHTPQLPKVPEVSMPNTSGVKNALKNVFLFPFKVIRTLLAFVWQLIVVVAIIAALYGVVMLFTPHNVPGEESVKSFFGFEYSPENVIQKCERNTMCDYRLISFSEVSEPEYVNIVGKGLHYINMSDGNVDVTVSSVSGVERLSFTLEPGGHIDGGVGGGGVQLQDPAVYIQFSAEDHAALYMLITHYQSDFIEKVSY